MTFTKVAATPRDLTDLPNISFALAEELRSVGIASPQALVGLGAEEAWTTLRSRGRCDDIHSLLALDGAVLGVTSQLLPADRRAELMRFAARAFAPHHSHPPYATQTACAP